MCRRKRNNIIFILIVCIFLFFAKFSFAEDNINFKNTSINNSLSQSTVQTIFQDSKGYIWLGTNDGLNRYNGHEMKIYRRNENNEDKNISDNYILDITEDKEKNIWVSTCYGLNKINFETGEIKKYLTGDESGNLSDNFINDTLVTKDGEILVATADGVNIYDKEKDSFKRILDKNSNMASQYIKTIIQSENGDIWIGTDSGINKIDFKTKEIKQFLQSERINSLLEDDRGYMWVSTMQEGVYKINKLDYSYKKIDPGLLPTDIVKKMCQDRFGNIWLSTEKGLVKYSYGNDRFSTYKSKSYDSQSLANDFVYCVMEDKSGLIWVGTYSGVSIFDPSDKILHYKHDPFDENTLSGNVVHGIYEDKDGLLWVGTKNNGVNIIDRETDTVKHIEEGDTEFNLSSNAVKVITGKDDKIWIGTNLGLNEINKKDMTVKVYNTFNNLAGDNIKSLLLDSKGYLWIGTPDGVSILDTKTSDIKNITEILKLYGVEDTYIEDIYEDKDGVYWLGTFLGGGLIKIDPNLDKYYIRIYKNNTENNSGAINTIRSIAEDDNGDLWIGTSNGLSVFNKNKETFINYTQNDGLPNNTIYGVLLDKYGNPWVSTNKGVSMYDRSENRFLNLSVTDGLQSNEFNGKAYHKNSKGELFFGGINGLNILNPDNIVEKDYVPNIEFDSFEVQGKEYSTINHNILKYNENFIKIKYFIPDYHNENSVHYEYRLEGLDEEWIKVNSNEVIYSKLDPGEYTFKVRYLSKGGILSEESTIDFIIQKPFWKSNIAIVLYSLLIIIVIYITINKVKTLDKLVEIRTKELHNEMKKNYELLNKVIKLEQNKNNYFVNLSHELRTPLNVINSIEQLITEFNKSEKGIDKYRLDYYMQMMRKNTKRLLNLINNIIDTTKIQNGSYKVDIGENDIVYLVEEAALGLKEYIESKGIELIIDTDVEEKYILCDYDDIERCIVNLVSNAAKFTLEGGKIEVYINDLGDSVKIIVKDNGIGIDEKFHKHIFDRFNQVIDSDAETKGGSGLGLTITKNIIDIHNGKIFVESKKNEGSTFTIILPVNNND